MAGTMHEAAFKEAPSTLVHKDGSSVSGQVVANVHKAEDESVDMRAELSSMRTGALRKLASAMGVDEDSLEQADDADNTKTALIEFILAIKAIDASGEDDSSQAHEIFYDIEDEDTQAQEPCESQSVNPDHEAELETEEGFVIVPNRRQRSRARTPSKRGDRSAEHSGGPLAAVDAVSAANAAMTALFMAVATGYQGADPGCAGKAQPAAPRRAKSRAASMKRHAQQASQPQGRRASSAAPRRQQQTPRVQMSRGSRR